jgi:hypothetical protein
LRVLSDLTPEATPNLTRVAGILHGHRAPI